MKILHVIATLDPEAGGPPSVAVALAAAQAQTDLSATILSATAPARREASLETFRRIPVVDQVQQCWVEEPTTAFAGLRGAASAEVARAVNACDVVHIHGIWEPLLLHAANAARRAGVPYVVAPHGMLDPWSVRQKRWKKRLALAAGYRRMLNGAAFLHVLNEDEGRLLAPLGLRASHRRVPNGVFLEEIDPLPDRGSSAAVVPQVAGRRYVLFLSRLHYKKGLDFLADAFARIAADDEQTQLVVVGPDVGAQVSFEERVTRAGLRARVHVTGPLYGDAKRAVLRDAACFCLPSRQEGFSMAITEAMAFGLPVVISQACHFPEVAEVGAGHVVDLAAESVADALVAVLADPEAARRHGTAGRRLVEERFTWERIAERLTGLYGELLAAAPAPRG